MAQLTYCFDKCIYDPSLVDGDCSSSFLFSFVDEIKIILENRLHLTGGIALLCAIEIAGREVLKFTNPGKKYTNTDRFNYFMSNYMNYTDLLKRAPRIYDCFRNGMIYEGFVKYDDTKEFVGFGTGYSSLYLQRLGIKKEELRGIVITEAASDMILDLLLYEFLEGVKIFREEELKNGWR